LILTLFGGLALMAIMAACSGEQPQIRETDTVTSLSATPLATQVEELVSAVDAAPGTDGLGDPLFSQLGNGGYDVDHYTIELDVAVEKNFISGKTTIEATTTQDLSAFNLDFAGLEVKQLEVDGQEEEFSREGSELTVELAEPIAEGTPFVVTVHYEGVPEPIADPSAPLRLGWQTQREGLFVVSEPSGSMNWYPGNNHPLDKATYTYRITVPEPYVVAANGLLAEQIDNEGTTTYVWQMDDPMASYLATVHIGQYEVETEQGPGELPIRHYFPLDTPEQARAAFEPVAEMITFLEDLIGPYPFDAYGVVMLTEPTGWALETQTLSTFGANRPPEEVVFHEIAHEWFGNSVSPATWQDIWLSEGFAVYLSRMWDEYNSDAETFNRQMSIAYDVLDNVRVGSPIPDEPRAMFSRAVYDRGAWTLHALRLAVGDETFVEILRTYYERFQYSTASTADFLEVVGEIGGAEAAELTNAWLTDPELPPAP
jgi:aminopeptidase N